MITGRELWEDSKRNLSMAGTIGCITGRHPW